MRERAFRLSPFVKELIKLSKQDGVYARTAASLEQKHNYGKRFAEVLGIVDDTRVKVGSVESSIATIRRTIDQNRSAIELLVEYDSEGNPTASGSFIIEAINGASSAKIAADRLDVEGKELNIKVNAANITGTFTVKETDGDTLFSAGNGVVKIGSWNVDNNSLWTGTSFSNPNSIFLSTGSNGNLSIAGSPAQKNWVFKAGPNFGVTKNGEVYCSKAHIKRGCILGEDITTGEGMQIGKSFQEEWATVRSFLRLFEVSGALNKGIEFVTTEGSDESTASEKSVILSNNYARLQSYNHTNTDLAIAEVYNDYAALEVSTSNHTAKVCASGDEVRLQFDDVFLTVDDRGVHCGNSTTNKDLFQA